MKFETALEEKYKDRMTVFQRPQDAVEAIENRGYHRSGQSKWTHPASGNRVFLTRLKEGFLVTWSEFEIETPYLYKVHL